MGTWRAFIRPDAVVKMIFCLEQGAGVARAVIVYLGSIRCNAASNFFCSDNKAAYTLHSYHF
jgi:hypothetical protein